MKTKEVPFEEFKTLWEDCKSKMQFTSPGFSPEMKRMTVAGLSGNGTDFANEYERLMYKHFNPDMPRSIRMVGLDGEELIVPGKQE